MMDGEGCTGQAQWAIALERVCTKARAGQRNVQKAKYAKSNTLATEGKRSCSLSSVRKGCVL